MSLVGDALRKARQEAALRDARQLGSNPLPPLARPLRRSRLGLGLLVGLLAGAAVAIASGAAVWWVVARPDATARTASEPEATVASAAPAVPADVPAPSAAEPAVAPPSDRRGAPTAEDRAGTVAALAPQSARETAEQEPPPRDAASRQAVDAVATAPPARPTSTPDTRSWTGTREFVLDADLGKAHLSLGYIVYRETDPFAEINGEEVHVGSQIEGLTVVSIEADRVTLRGLDRTVVLRTR